MAWIIWKPDMCIYSIQLSADCRILKLSDMLEYTIMKLMAFIYAICGYTTMTWWYGISGISSTSDIVVIMLKLFAEVKLLEYHHKLSIWV
jgi:hypothetical protein